MVYKFGEECRTGIREILEDAQRLEALEELDEDDDDPEESEVS